MNTYYQAANNYMRREGYAVVVMTPSELDGVNPRGLEAFLAEAAADYIERMRAVQEAGV